MSADDRQFSVGLVGDCLLTRHIAMSEDSGLLRLREILRGADVVFANMEAPVHNFLDDPQEQRSGGGTYMTTEPGLLEDFKWLGIEMIACGSSHANDYGSKGVMDTIRYLDAAGITHAGSGRHLAEARAPGFRDCAAGRFALLAANSQYRPGTRAGEQRYDSAGFPGVNGLRHRTEYVVDRESLDQLTAIGRRIGLDAAEARARFQGDPVRASSESSTDFLGNTFVVGDQPAVRTYANPHDLEENGRQVRHARAFADTVIASLHCHDQGGPTLLTARRRADVEDIADFAVEYGRRCIDEGADIFVAHGPQVPLGIEMYRGKPLFHGLGTFIFQIETLKYLPAEAYERYGLDERATPADFVERRYQGDSVGHTADPDQWWQVAVMCDYAHGALQQIRLYPIELGHNRPRSQRGTPRLADAAIGRRIIERLARLSERFGTVIKEVDGVGIVPVADA